MSNHKIAYYKGVQYIVVDLFCGAGGVTAGFEMTDGLFKVIAAINHDHTAILSHWTNHPDVVHFEEDIRLLELSGLVEVVNKARELNPNAKLILWASLECTNFSKAKGGMARDADSRTLAENLYMHYDPIAKQYYVGDSYIQLLSPDYIMIENVVEFKDWGPSRIKMKDGKPVTIRNKHKEIVYGYEPIPEQKGQDFERWKKEICALGYHTDWNELNSADFGAFTSRNRLFGVFAKHGLPIIWPAPTHNKKGTEGLKKWKAVKEKLDFTDEGYSIFDRGRNPNIPKRQRKDLSPNTLERVYAGCIKHIAGGKEAFMIKYHGGIPRTKDTDAPLTVIDTQNRHAIVQPSFISKYYGGNPASKNTTINEPCGTVRTKDCHGLVQASFISIYHGNGDNTRNINEPSPTLTAADIHAAVFIDRDFSKGCSSSIDAPAGSIMTNPKLNLVQADAFIDTSNFKSVPFGIDSAGPTILANRKYPYLVNLQWGGQMTGVGKPAPTLLATANKTPLYLVMTQTGPAVQINEWDSPIVVKLKEFMQLYGIIDIKMRMLRVDELLKIQGFPDSYRLAGTQEEQKKFIGNSVVPHVVKAMAFAMAGHRRSKITISGHCTV